MSHTLLSCMSQIQTVLADIDLLYSIYSEGVTGACHQQTPKCMSQKVTSLLNTCYNALSNADVTCENRAVSNMQGEFLELY